MCIRIGSYSSRDLFIFLNYVEKRQKPSGNFAKTFFVFHFRRSPEKNFEDLSFLRTRWRQCPWSLALASSISVLGLERVCPRKGCPWPLIFLCPWPWPRALCPRLHLWLAPLTTKPQQNMCMHDENQSIKSCI